MALQAKTASAGATSGSFGIGKGGLDPKAALFWCFVGIPIAWGVWITLKNATSALAGVTSGALFWCFVGIPIAWGVWITLKNATSALAGVTSGLIFIKLFKSCQCQHVLL